MPGGLMTLISYGSENIFLNGNPSKTFFKATYKKYTNFGMQKFRVDYDGLRNLRLNEEVTFKFKMPRYADLINDTYLVVNIPNIWSALYVDDDDNYIEQGFKWIDDLGTNMIKEVVVMAGSQIITQYTGEYINALQQRDFSRAKKNLFNEMIGNVPELNDPANTNGNVNIYPNAFFQGTPLIEPSIRQRTLYIPLECWFTQTSKMAFPLISLQYEELHIHITMRPIRELYMIRDVEDATNNYPYISPNINLDINQLYRYLNPPLDISGTLYANTNENWNADIHILSTYVFLSNEEQMCFAKEQQQYLVNLPYETDYYNVTGSKVVDLESRDLVSCYMWRFRRSDAFMRNTWSNYTNWPYNNIPYGLSNIATLPPDIFITGNLENENQKSILLDLGIVIDGKYRENMMLEGVYNLVEKYIRTTGNAKFGLYCYNFCIDSNARELQPSGAMNMNKYNKITFEFNTFQPPVDPSATFQTICDTDGNVIGYRKPLWRLNDYNFDLHVFEERYNLLIFSNGMCGLKYAR